MKALCALSLVAFVSCVAYSSGQSETVLQKAASMQECWDTVYRYNCELSTLAQDGADVALGCGDSYISFAESYISQCTKGPGDEYCLNLYLFSKVDFSEATECASAMAGNSTSCSIACRNFLQSVVDSMGCCLNTIFNERLSPILLQHDVRVSLAACNITAERACVSPITLTSQNVTQPCTLSEIWGRFAELLCRPDENQGYIDYLVKENFACRPIAKAHVDACGRGPKDKYCVHLFETSYNPTNPMRVLSVHPGLKNAVTQCANYSSFQSAGCPVACRSAIEAAIDSVGCCINLFNDTVNEILLPQFSAEVMMACEIDSPGICESSLKLGSGSEALRSFNIWIHIWSALLMAFLYQQ